MTNWKLNGSEQKIQDRLEKAYTIVAESIIPTDFTVEKTGDPSKVVVMVYNELKRLPAESVKGGS